MAKGVFALLFLLLSAVCLEGAFAVEDVPTPVGYLPKDCVHTVPSGSRVVEEEDGSLRVEHREFGDRPFRVPKCEYSFPSDYNGWLQYTAFNISTGSIDAFLGSFSVPDKPQYPPQVLYIFPGLQNIDWIPKVDPLPSVPFDIIQPVLQYPGDYGLYWSVKSWYVTLNGGALASEEVRLDVGDTVIGNMTRTGPDSWDIVSTSAKTGKSTLQSVKNSRLRLQPWAYNTLECYGCNDCSTYPTTPCEFSKLQLFSGGQKITPKWVPNPKPQPEQKCNEAITVHSSEAVTIFFDKQ